MSNSFVEFEEVVEFVYYMCDICGEYCLFKLIIKENCVVGRGEIKIIIFYVVCIM